MRKALRRALSVGALGLCRLWGPQSSGALYAPIRCYTSQNALETTARAQLQSRQVRETLGAEVNSGPQCVFACGLNLFFQEAAKQQLM